MARFFLITGLLGLASGCAGAATPAPPPVSAPALLVMHAEGSVEPLKRPTIKGSADIGFESTGCCSLGFYVAVTQDADSEAVEAANENTRESTQKPDSADDPAKSLNALEGGLELGVVIPAWNDRLRIRGRAGKAGTTPRTVSLGREGVSTSLAVLMRVWDLPAPETNSFKADVDVMVGVSVLSLQREATSAGGMGKPYSDAALMLGVRIGTDYGIDLE